MTKFISKSHLDFLSDNQRTELAKQFITVSKNLMPHQLATKLGIEYSKALAVLTVLEKEEFCQMKLLIYHNCEPDVASGTIPFGQGFPNIPWVCPLCEKSVYDYKELSFDFMAFHIQQIEFI